MVRKRGRLLAVLVVALVGGWIAPAQAADAPVAGTIDLARVAARGGNAVGTDERFAAGAPAAAVAFAGDVDRDGDQDFAIGMPSAEPVGHVAVVLGPPDRDGPAPPTDLRDLG